MSIDLGILEFIQTYLRCDLLDSVMPDQKDLIVKILQKLTARQRADILSQMSVENVATLTVEMEK